MSIQRDIMSAVPSRDPSLDLRFGPLEGQGPTRELSIVVPALNEQENIGPLVEQVETGVRRGAGGGGIDAELIVVDDGSTDRTRAVLAGLQRTRPWLRILSRTRSTGQSAAMGAGIAAARGRYIATLDADLQNDPADLCGMLALLRERDVDMVQGDRSADRRDRLVRRAGSVVGRLARRCVLGDRVRDTGCSARVVKAEFLRSMPLQFAGMHRFFPAYVRMMGGRIAEVRAHHRPRVAGRSKYGAGLHRAVRGLFDLLAVRWMARRVRDTSAEETAADTDDTVPASNGTKESDRVRSGG